MPEGYEKIRDKFIDQGEDEQEAKKRASAIWNSIHPENPVTRNYEDSRKKKSSKSSTKEKSK